MTPKDYRRSPTAPGGQRRARAGVPAAGDPGVVTVDRRGGRPVSSALTRIEEFLESLSPRLARRRDRASTLAGTRARRVGRGARSLRARSEAPSSRLSAPASPTAARVLPCRQRHVRHVVHLMPSCASDAVPGAGLSPVVRFKRWAHRASGRARHGVSVSDRSRRQVDNARWRRSRVGRVFHLRGRRYGARSTRRPRSCGCCEGHPRSVSARAALPALRYASARTPLLERMRRRLRSSSRSRRRRFRASPHHAR